MQMYGPHSLNEDGSIIPFEEQMAIVSHYLHNQITIHQPTRSSKEKQQGV